MAGAICSGLSGWPSDAKIRTGPIADSGAAETTLRVVLSDHFARYAVLPWHAELTAPAEREGLASLADYVIGRDR